MADVLKWLRSTSKLVFDPNREQRIAEQAKEVWRHIAHHKREFNYDTACLVIGVELQDRRAVAERVFQNSLSKAWANGLIDATERQSLNVIGGLLSLPADRRRELEWEACSGVFRAALAAAIADGTITADERDALAAIAAGFGQTTRGVMLAAFAEEGNAFLQDLFDRMLLKGSFNEHDWRSLVASAASLGLTEDELRQAIAPQTQRVVEQSLAQAKADGSVSQAEYNGLLWLIDMFGLSPAVRHYVDAEVADVNDLARIRDGHLPAVVASGLQLRAGEIVHHFGAGVYARTRMRKTGEHVERHDGTIAVTDSRLIFVSSTAGVELNHRKVLGLEVGPRGSRGPGQRQGGRLLLLHRW